MSSQAPSNPVGDEAGLNVVRRVGLWLGLAVFVALLIAPQPQSLRDTAAGIVAGGWTDAAPTAGIQAWRIQATVAVTALVAIWWTTDAIPIPATSLIPIALFPILGIMPIAKAAAPYANHNVYLFMGGFILALGIERWHLHRRIALHVVRLVGTRRTRLVLGFMVASAFLSMWISNTATTMLMLPIGLAVIATLDRSADALSGDARRFAAALMLAIAYGASIGGVATPIGTPPNIVFSGQYESLFPDAPAVGFGQWMLIFAPLVVVFLPIAWWVIVRGTCRFSSAAGGDARQTLRDELRRLGPLKGPERTMLIVFALTALLWVTRSIPVGGGDVGWAALLEHALPHAAGRPGFSAHSVNDTVVAVVMAIVLFILPAGRDDDGRPRRMMDWETAKCLPWGILLLFGGGFAIAQAFRVTGVSLWASHALVALNVHQPLPLVAGTSTLLAFLTNLTSNTATTQVMLPVVAETARSLGVHPLLLMLAATISASCAFMLPVATPPNAIVFGSGRLRMRDMLLTGLVLNVIGIVLVTLLLVYWAVPVLGIG